MDPVTNLRVLKRTNKKPQAGDFFAMQLPDERYLFGRVIIAEPPRERAPMPMSYLIYVYRHESDGPEPDYSKLIPERLLIPPVFINRKPWTKGYFLPLGNRPIQRGDLLQQHCFWRSRGDFVDEVGNKLSGPTEPCGDWGLASYRWLDDHVSDALGIPRAPD